MPVILLLLLAVAALGQLTDHNIHLPPATPTAVKGTWFTDPTFGSRILRITDATTGTTRCNVQGAYGYWPSFNSNSTRIVYHCVSGATTTSYFATWNPDVAPYVTVTDSTTDGFSGAWASNGWWSKTDPDLFYFFNYGNVLSVYNATSKAVTTVDTVDEIDTSVQYASHLFMSDDGNRWVVTRKRKSDGVGVGYVVGQISPLQILLNVNDGAETSQTMIDHAGAWVVRVVAAAAHQYIRVFDGAVVTNPGGYGHRDVGSGAVIYAYWNTEPLIRKWVFGEGAPTNVGTAMYADDFSWLATNTPWAVLSWSSAEYCDTVAHCGEIYELNTDGSGAVRRWAHHHTDFTGGSFVDEAYASQSYDRRFIAFQSNWGGPTVASGGRMDVFVIDTRGAAPTSRGISGYLGISGYVNVRP